MTTTGTSTTAPFGRSLLSSNWKLITGVHTLVKEMGKRTPYVERREEAPERGRRGLPEQEED
jgi:hypothetical protein